MNTQQPSKSASEAIKQEPKSVQQSVQPAAPPADATRKEKFQKGITGGAITEVERTIPADEPPPLPPNAQLKQIGKPVPRYDGHLKVTGSAKYPSDIKLPGMLYAKLVSSTVAHGRVKSVDTSAAEKLSGVRAVHVVERVLGNAELIDKSKELPSKYPVVRYAGQPIAAVAATSAAIAAEAANLVKIEYETLPFVLTIDEARKKGSPLVFPGIAAAAGSAGGGGGAQGVPQKGNVRGPSKGGQGRGPRGDLEKGFAASEVIVEGEFRTQVQTHSALETHGVVADWKQDSLTVYASTQGTLSVRDELAAIFDLPKSKVRVVTEFMGGGFGAKFGAGNSGVIAARLSRQANAPVKLFLDRKEEHWGGGNRPGSIQRLKLGATKDGKLQAMHLISYGTAGVGTGAGSAGPVQNLYDCANVLTEESDVFTNGGPGAAFRAPGHPQGCFALEQSIDELAHKVNLDVLAVMDKNDSNEPRRMERRIGAERFGWSKRHAPGADPGPVKRGMGVAQSVWYRIGSRDSECEVRITNDGAVEALSAVQDIGGGIKTVIAQVVAEEFGLQPKDITIRIGDTNSPSGPPSGGSQTTGSFTPAARNAAYKARLKFAEAIAPVLKTTPDKLVFADGKVSVAGGASLTFRQAAAKMNKEQISAHAQRAPEYGARERMFIGGVQFCEIEVDTETGVIRPVRFLAVHDCGRPMNTLALQSQVNGGILQGISFALYEDRKLDRNTGVMVNPNLEQYKILGAKETPPIEVHFLEDLIARSSTDASGIGEPSTIPTSAAMANAFFNATGVRIRELPMTPARVLGVLGKIKTAGSPTSGGAL